MRTFRHCFAITTRLTAGPFIVAVVLVCICLLWTQDDESSTEVDHIAGLWLHLLQDLVTNRPRHAGVYALTYRLRHGFRREVTGWDDKTNFHAWSHKPWYQWF